MKTSNQPLQTSLAQSVAGEDLQTDEFIAVLSTTGEYLSHAWDRCDLPPHEVVRVRYVPSIAGLPLKITGICLPFVYTRRSNDIVEIIDLRMTVVARLNTDCAKAVWKQLKEKASPVNMC